MGTISGERSVQIDAPVERCYEIASDIDHAPEWQGSLKDVEVLERDGSKRALLVETESDAKVKTVRAVLRFSYEEPTAIRSRPIPAAYWGCSSAGQPRRRCATSCSATPPRASSSVPRPAEPMLVVWG